MTNPLLPMLIAMASTAFRVPSRPILEAWMRLRRGFRVRRMVRMHPLAGGANRSTELMNDARDLVERAKKANDENDTKAYNTLWTEYEAKQKEADEELGREQDLKSAFEKYDAKPTDDRDPREAVPSGDGQIKTLDPYHAKTGVQLADGRVVAFATKDTEGWMRGKPASVQHPQIIRRLTPDLMAEAQQESNAFWKYIRLGRSSLREKSEIAALNRLSVRSPLSGQEMDILKGEKAALQEGTDTEGGFLVPSDQVRLPPIDELGVRGGRFRPLSQQFTTTRDSGDWPRTTDDVTWVAIAEEAAPTEDNPTIAQSAFTIRKFGRINKVSVELLEDSAVDVPSLLGRLFTRGLGRFEDQQGIEGDGTTEPLGLRTTGQGPGDIADSVGDYNASTNPDWDDVVTHYFALPEQFRDNLAWFMTSSFLRHLVAITGAGVPRAVEFMGDPVRPVVLGRPVVMFDGTGWDDAAAIAINEEFGVVGDFSYYYFITRVGMTVRRLDELYAGNDQVGFFARTRYDSFYGHEDAFRIMKAAAA